VCAFFSLVLRLCRGRNTCASPVELGARVRDAFSERLATRGPRGILYTASQPGACLSRSSPVTAGCSIFPRVAGLDSLIMFE